MGPSGLALNLRTPLGQILMALSSKWPGLDLEDAVLQQTPALMHVCLSVRSCVV